MHFKIKPTLRSFETTDDYAGRSVAIKHLLRGYVAPVPQQFCAAAAARTNWLFRSHFISAYLKAGLNNSEVVVPNKAPPKTSLG